MLAIALLLTGAIGALRILDDRASDAPAVLFVVPIALCAVRFGIKGGVASASIGLGLLVALSLSRHDQLTLVGYGTRSAAFFLVGAIVGSFADRRRQLEDEWRGHQNLSLDLIANANFDGFFTQVNSAWTNTLGHTQEELLARPFIDFVHPDDREATIAETVRLGALGGDATKFQNRYRHRDGSYRWFEWMVRPDASTKSLYAIARDITTRNEAEDSLRLLLEQLAQIQRAIAERSRLDEILDTIVRAAAKVVGCDIAGLRLIDENDPSYVILAASCGLDEKLERVLRRGPTTEGVGGRAIVEERLIISNDYGTQAGEIKSLAGNGLRAAMAAPVYGHGAVVGSVVVATTTDRPFSDADAETLAFFAEYAGVAVSTARAADAVRQALTDPLTGLPNRSLFIDRLDHASARAERAFGELSLLFLDVDEFKLVNDSLGHLAGDRLLIEIAKRLRTCLRRSDTAARLGGDEFAVLLSDKDDAPDAEFVGARIVEALSVPFDIDGHELRVSASIGIVTGRREAPEDLLRDADVAMYRAKATNRGGLCVFEPGMQADVVRELDLRNELLRAVECKEITVAYQPIVSLRDGSIVALEALARWDHPTRGSIPPDVFIPLAESAGAIDVLGALVLHTACAQLAEWRFGHPERSQLQLTVNVSPDQLGQGLIDETRRALDENGLPPTALVLEITERSLLNDSEGALIQLAQLRSLGIQLAIDDFGTGYSSLSYLRRFPVDILKIAKPFVDGIENDHSEEWAFVRLIIGLATTLGLKAVAEGIEVSGQRDRLVELNCPYGQGYLYSRPVDATKVDALLAADTEHQLRSRVA